MVTSSGPTLTVVLLIGHFLLPVDVLAIERFGNGHVCHATGGRCAVPMLHARRCPDNVAGLDLLLFTAFLLHPAGTGLHDERLAKGMGVPGGTRAGLERHV